MANIGQEGLDKLFGQAGSEASPEVRALFEPKKQVPDDVGELFERPAKSQDPVVTPAKAEDESFLNKFNEFSRDTGEFLVNTPRTAVNVLQAGYGLAERTVRNLTGNTDAYGTSDFGLAETYRKRFGDAKDASEQAAVMADAMNSGSVTDKAKFENYVKYGSSLKLEPIRPFMETEKDKVAIRAKAEAEKVKTAAIGLDDLKRNFLDITKQYVKTSDPRSVSQSLGAVDIMSADWRAKYDELSSRDGGLNEYGKAFLREYAETQKRYLDKTFEIARNTSKDGVLEIAPAAEAAYQSMKEELDEAGRKWANEKRFVNNEKAKSLIGKIDFSWNGLANLGGTAVNIIGFAMEPVQTGLKEGFTAAGASVGGIGGDFLDLKKADIQKYDANYLEKIGNIFASGQHFVAKNSSDMIPALATMYAGGAVATELEGAVAGAVRGSKYAKPILALTDDAVKLWSKEWAVGKAARILPELAQNLVMNPTISASFNMLTGGHTFNSQEAEEDFRWNVIGDSVFYGILRPQFRTAAAKSWFETFEKAADPSAYMTAEFFEASKKGDFAMMDAVLRRNIEKGVTAAAASVNKAFSELSDDAAGNVKKYFGEKQAMEKTGAEALSAEQRSKLAKYESVKKAMDDAEKATGSSMVTAQAGESASKAVKAADRAYDAAMSGSNEVSLSEKGNALARLLSSMYVFDASGERVAKSAAELASNQNLVGLPEEALSRISEVLSRIPAGATAKDAEKAYSEILSVIGKSADVQDGFQFGRFAKENGRWTDVMTGHDVTEALSSGKLALTDTDKAVHAIVDAGYSKEEAEAAWASFRDGVANGSFSFERKGFEAVLRAFPALYSEKRFMIRDGKYVLTERYEKYINLAQSKAAAEAIARQDVERAASILDEAVALGKEAATVAKEGETKYVGILDEKFDRAAKGRSFTMALSQFKIAFMSAANAFIKGGDLFSLAKAGHEAAKFLDKDYLKAIDDVAEGDPYIAGALFLSHLKKLEGIGINLFSPMKAGLAETAEQELKFKVMSIMLDDLKGTFDPEHFLNSPGMKALWGDSLGKYADDLTYAFSDAIPEKEGLERFGAYETKRKLILMTSRSLRDSKTAEKTFAHEFSHSLEDYMTKEEVSTVERLFKLDKDETAHAMVSRGEAATYSEAISKIDSSVTAKEPLYRFKDVHEYFAENMMEAMMNPGHKKAWFDRLPAPVRKVLDYAIAFFSAASHFKSRAKSEFATILSDMIASADKRIAEGRNLDFWKGQETANLVNDLENAFSWDNAFERGANPLFTNEEMTMVASDVLDSIKGQKTEPLAIGSKRVFSSAHGSAMEKMITLETKRERDGLKWFTDKMTAVASSDVTGVQFHAALIKAKEALLSGEYSISGSDLAAIVKAAGDPSAAVAFHEAAKARALDFEIKMGKSYGKRGEKEAGGGLKVNEKIQNAITVGPVSGTEKGKLTSTVGRVTYADDLTNFHTGTVKFVPSESKSILAGKETQYLDSGNKFPSESEKYEPKKGDTMVYSPDVWSSMDNEKKKSLVASGADIRVMRAPFAVSEGKVEISADHSDTLSRIMSRNGIPHDVLPGKTQASSVAKAEAMGRRKDIERTGAALSGFLDSIYGDAGRKNDYMYSTKSFPNFMPYPVLFSRIWEYAEKAGHAVRQTVVGDALAAMSSFGTPGYLAGNALKKAGVNENAAARAYVSFDKYLHDWERFASAEGKSGEIAESIASSVKMVDGKPDVESLSEAIMGKAFDVSNIRVPFGERRAAVAQAVISLYGNMGYPVRKELSKTPWFSFFFGSPAEYGAKNAARAVILSSAKTAEDAKGLLERYNLAAKDISKRNTYRESQLAGMITLASLLRSMGHLPEKVSPWAVISAFAKKEPDAYAALSRQLSSWTSEAEEGMTEHRAQGFGHALKKMVETISPDAGQPVKARVAKAAETVDGDDVAESVSETISSGGTKDLQDILAWDVIQYMDELKSISDDIAAARHEIGLPSMEPAGTAIGSMWHPYNYKLAANGSADFLRSIWGGFDGKSKSAKDLASALAKRIGIPEKAIMAAPAVGESYFTPLNDIYNFLASGGKVWEFQDEFAFAGKGVKNLKDEVKNGNMKISVNDNEWNGQSEPYGKLASALSPNSVTVVTAESGSKAEYKAEDFMRNPLFSAVVNEMEAKTGRRIWSTSPKSTASNLLMALKEDVPSFADAEWLKEAGMAQHLDKSFTASVMATRISKSYAREHKIRQELLSATKPDDIARLEAELDKATSMSVPRYVAAETNKFRLRNALAKMVYDKAPYVSEFVNDPNIIGDFGKLLTEFRLSMDIERLKGLYPKKISAGVDGLKRPYDGKNFLPSAYDLAKDRNFVDKLGSVLVELKLFKDVERLEKEYSKEFGTSARNLRAKLEKTVSENGSLSSLIVKDKDVMDDFGRILHELKITDTDDLEDVFGKVAAKYDKPVEIEDMKLYPIKNPVYRTFQEFDGAPDELGEMVGWSTGDALEEIGTRSVSIQNAYENAGFSILDNDGRKAAFSAEFTSDGKQYRIEADGNGNYDLAELDLPDTMPKGIGESVSIKADDISVSDC